jgi:maltooligosyltrehalose trehalohydrolase
MSWKPTLGAWRNGGKTYFRLWAPEARTVEAVRETKGAAELSLPLGRSADGFFEGSSSEFQPGDLYRYRIDGQGSYPDPASRWQPQGVHGPSQVVDAAAFGWTDAEWRGRRLEELVLYELHVGTFTPAGTLQAAAEKLPVLHDLGVTAVELMPVADFPGDRNWGYDGVALFAPARCYGTPDDLRRLVDEAHRIGLAVHLDVVYNHFGPDGAYHGVYSPYYFSRTHKSPWGAAVNFDGPQSAGVRKFFIENALYWIHEYHLDGLRLDATHAIVDTSGRHFLAELSDAVRESLSAGSEAGRAVVVIAEDVRNLAWMVKPESEEGWGLDGVWSDDFHHEMRRFLAGDRDGYFEDFGGTAEEIAATARHGWFYSGQYAPFFGQERGSDPGGIPPQRFVFFLQNHDQVGNRALGERLNHQIDAAAYRAATALLLLLPETPLLFMGQEWAASAPFQFFTDHHAELGKRVTEGRRDEFRRFAAFADPETRRRIPDPQEPQTFERSRLDWEEREAEPHASTIRYYRSLLALRRSEAALNAGTGLDIWELDADTLLLRRREATGGDLLAVIRLRGAGTVDLRGIPYAHIGLARRWRLLLTSEEAEFAPDAKPPRVDESGPAVEFARPGAALFRLELSEPGRTE